MLDNLLLGTSLAALTAASTMGWLFYNRTRAFNVQLQTEVDARKDLEAQLAKYSHIIDTEAEVQRLITSAREKANVGLQEARDEATRLLEEARRQADGLIQSAHGRMQEATADRIAAEVALSVARTKASEEAKSIVAAAEARAAEVLEALSRADVLRREVEALEAKIKGYGNTHVIPGRSLLDDLAAEYDHSQAGRDLKELRARIRAVSKDGAAATCDYVEHNRRTTAINFVTDAFNGKVEDIISRTKTDNFGILKREIEDAFVLVNMNGRAFRDARIRPDYLDLRIEELRLATIMGPAQDLFLIIR